MAFPQKYEVWLLGKSLQSLSCKEISRKVTFIHLHPADLTFSSRLSFCSRPVFQEFSLTMSSISNTPICNQMLFILMLLFNSLVITFVDIKLITMHIVPLPMVICIFLRWFPCLRKVWKGAYMRHTLHPDLFKTHCCCCPDSFHTRCTCWVTVEACPRTWEKTK